MKRGPVAVNLAPNGECLPLGRGTTGRPIGREGVLRGMRATCPG